MPRPASSVRVFLVEIVQDAHIDVVLSAFYFSRQKFRQKFRGIARAVAMLLLVLLPAGCQRKTPPPANVTVAMNPAPVVPAAVVPQVVATPIMPLALYRPSPRIFEALESPPRQTPVQKVALTFDAGSDDSAVQAILAQLKAHQTHATFFLTGRFCEQYPDSCRAIADAGMEIGNHSYSHPYFTKRKDAEITEQLAKADAAIQKACGRSTRPLFRFPYGDCNRHTRQVVATAGYQPIGWTLDSLDSVGAKKSANYVANRIIRKIKPGYVTLMHVSYPQSAAALPRIFAYLEKQHLQAVPVSELLLASPPAATGGDRQKAPRPMPSTPGSEQKPGAERIQSARR